MSRQDPLDVNPVTSRRGARQSDIDEIRRATNLLAFPEPGDVVELRLPGSTKQTISGYFNDPEKLVEAAAAVSGRFNAGVYFTLNPVRPQLLARSVNRLSHFSKFATSDQDILQRRWLPLDFDPVRPAGISSTDKEHEAAITMACQVNSELQAQGWPNGIILDSGNGAQLLFRVNLASDETSRGLIAGVLKGLAKRYNTPGVEIDVRVGNAARIWKLPGTLAMKGDCTAERPHRLARILSLPEVEVEVVTPEQLQSVAEPEEHTNLSVSKDHCGRFDLDQFLAGTGDRYKRSAWKGSGCKYVFETCPNNAAHKHKFCITQQHGNGAISAKCQHESCKGFDWPAYRQLHDPGYRPVNGNAEARNRTDYGNAERMVAVHGQDLHYIAGRGVQSAGAWLVWNGTRWVPDATLEVHRRAKATVRAMSDEAIAIQDPDRRKAAIHFALHSESSSRIDAMISMARSQPGIPVRRSDFDCVPLLLNTPNGTLELDVDSSHGHRFREHRRGDMITMITNASYDPVAQAPRWARFLREVTKEDIELIRYLAQLAGLALTGLTEDHLFLILWGNGANGKSTFLEALAFVLGGYARMADVATFIAANDTRVRNDIARLHGARLVTANESELGQRLAEALIKSLTGGDTISARFLYEESFEFKPQAKFWLCTNNKPVVRGQDEGIWRRVRLVPLNVQIPEDQQDKKLPKKLEAEAAGILNWMLEGLRDYLANGLQTPGTVRDATRQYREDQDVIQHFINARCIVDVNAVVGKAALYEAYRDWTEQERTYTKNGPEFREQMLRCFKEFKNNRGSFWRGLALKPAGKQAQQRTGQADT